MKLKTLAPILIGGLAALIAMNYFGRKPEQRPRYYVALAEVTEHQALRSEWIGAREWTESRPLPPDFIRDRQLLEGRFARRPITKGAPLTELMLWPAGVDSLMMAKLRNEPGMRAVPVKVDDVTGGGGFVQPGNRVDVIATDGKRKAARTILQGVEVLAVNRSDRPGSEIEKKGKGNDVPRYVTLLLSLKQAEIVKAAASAREVTLNLLLGAENAEKMATHGASLDEVLGTPSSANEESRKPTRLASIPPRMPNAPAAGGGPRPDHVVQVFHGNRCEQSEFRKAGGSWSLITSEDKQRAAADAAAAESNDPSAAPVQPNSAEPAPADDASEPASVASNYESASPGGSIE